MIHISNVSKSFGTAQAVNNVSLDIGRGELFGLLGPNGAGKSTLINILVGLLGPDAGVVAYGDVSITGGKGSGRQRDIRRVLGLVP